MINEVRFINSYSFIFSPRPGTVAENLKIIDKNISSERLERVQKELSNIQINKNKSFENKELDVLVENQTKDKTKVFGRSEYMSSVIFDGKKEDIGKILTVKIKKSSKNSLFGENINKKKLVA